MEEKSSDAVSHSRVESEAAQLQENKARALVMIGRIDHLIDEILRLDLDNEEAVQALASIYPILRRARSRLEVPRKDGT